MEEINKFRSLDRQKATLFLSLGMSSALKELLVKEGEKVECAQVPKEWLSQEDELYNLCKCADQSQIEGYCLSGSLCVEDVWDGVSTWLIEHSVEDVKQKSKFRDEDSKTVLQIACLNNVPPKIFIKLLRTAGDLVSATCNEGKTALHYACIGGCKEKVIDALVQVNPGALSLRDQNGLTPLNCALLWNRGWLTPSIVKLICSEEAASCTNKYGKLPLHLACQEGLPKDIVRTIVEQYPEGALEIDNRLNTPPYYLISRANRCKASEDTNALKILEVMLLHNPDVANIKNNNESLVLHHIARAAERIERSERNYCTSTLLAYLDSKPECTEEFFTGLQSCPDWLKNDVFSAPGSYFQDTMNKATSTPFPMMVLMLDAYFLTGMIVCFNIAARNTLDCIFYEERYNDMFVFCLVFISVASFYFGLREVLQFFSLRRYGLQKQYLGDSKNILDILVITLGFVWVGLMAEQYMHGCGPVHNSNKEWFRPAMSITNGVYLMSVLFFLRSHHLDFAVFVAGVFNVMRKLSTFLISLFLVLVFFAEMFTLVYKGTKFCECVDGSISSDDCEEYYGAASFCSFGESLETVYYMLLSLIEPDRIVGSTMGTLLFVLFMFIVAILLANVLIAIVTDSYRDIQVSRATQVFWRDRFDFIAEMEGIKRMIQRTFPWCFGKKTFSSKSRERWGFYTDLFSRPSNWSNEFIVHWALYDSKQRRWRLAFYRLVCGPVIVLWFVIGLLTAGLLWPPQMREVLTREAAEHKAKDVHCSKGELETERERIQMADEIKGIHAEISMLADEIKDTKAILSREIREENAKVTVEVMNLHDELKEMKEILLSLRRS